MLFKPELIELIKAEIKRKTRRPVKPGQRGNITVDGKSQVILHNRLQWEVGRIYAIQPGQGKPAVGHFRLTSIGLALVKDISPVEVRAEGFETRGEFFKAWRSFYGTVKGECWVLGIKYLGGERNDN